MNILVVGAGGREHALAWKLAQSPRSDRIFVAPGNAGTASEGGKIENVPIKDHDIPALTRFAQENNIGLTVVGPEVPLCAGIVDAFEAQSLRIFGPNKAAAQLEGSKIFCKKILRKGNVPTARYWPFTKKREALDQINEYARQNAFERLNELELQSASQQMDNALRQLGADNIGPVVVKADGLAAGKGVFVCDDHSEVEIPLQFNRETNVPSPPRTGKRFLPNACTPAERAILRITRDREFGRTEFILEERLLGQEASVLAITDGRTIVTLQPAQDHKAAYDGDTGPNTGGMGAYSPAPIVDDSSLHWIEEHILVPTVHALKSSRTPFKGILFAGLMIHEQRGIKVLEYNVRFGDPECQPLLMRLKTDLVDLFEATIDGKLDELAPLDWDTRSAVCVVMASEGYPGEYEKGFPIQGLEEAAKVPNTKVFHAGTAINESGQIVNSGGRVLGVTGLGDTVSEAKSAAYAAVERIHWDGAWYRTDISDKAIS